MKIGLTPGEIRGLQFLAEKYPDCVQHLTQFKDQAGAGWLEVHIHEVSRAFRPKDYEFVVSTTGRVWRSMGRKRLEPPIRDADYTNPETLGASSRP